MAGENEDHAGLLEAILPEEFDALKTIGWQGAALAGEAVFARIEHPAGITGLTGALPFIETRKRNGPQDQGWQATRSDNFAQYLVQNRALCRSYLQKARSARLSLSGLPAQAKIYQVTTEISGIEAASFAVFLAAQAAADSKRVLLIDADTKNQFVFPLLGFEAEPPVLTENLQKPSAFRTDLTRCIVKAFPGVDYLNMQATSLRPFSDAELCRIAGFLDAVFDCIIFYSGRLQSRWLTLNAEATFAVCAPSYKSEIAALVRHAGSAHTVLLRRGEERYFPCLTPEFSKQLPADRWQTVNPELNVLRDFVQKVLRSYRILLGQGEIQGGLSVLSGPSLLIRLSGEENDKTETALNALQGKLRAYYPKNTFFSARSAYRRMTRYAVAPVTVLLEVAGNTHLVSLPSSPELLATAIFPVGAIPALKHNDTRLIACSATGIRRFGAMAARGGFSQVLAGPRIQLAKPNALAAMLEQMQP